MEKYHLVAKKGEGSFSVVIKAVERKTKKYVALKLMRSKFENEAEVESLDEVQTLKYLSKHPNIINLLDIHYCKVSGRLCLSFELMDLNLFEALSNATQWLPERKALNWMRQLLTAIEFLHSKGVFHRDIKPENLLLLGDTLKLADFGSCRVISDAHKYTEYVSTRWYRPPECMLTSGIYGAKMDVWAAGCVYFEILALTPLFPGIDDVDQINRIHEVLGTPDNESLKQLPGYASGRFVYTVFKRHAATSFEPLLRHCDPAILAPLTRMLAYFPHERASAKSLRHDPVFSLVDRVTEGGLDSTHELTRRIKPVSVISVA